MPYTLRPFDPERDFPRWADIQNSFDPIKITVAMLKEFYDSRAAGGIDRYIVAVDKNGYMVGGGVTRCPPWMFDRKWFNLSIGVDPAYYRQGIGSMIYEDLCHFAVQYGVTLFESGVEESLTDALHFTEKRGFSINRHIFDSILNIATFYEYRDC